MTLSKAILILSDWERNWETRPNSPLVQLARAVVWQYAMQATPGDAAPLNDILEPETRLAA